MDLKLKTERVRCRAWYAGCAVLAVCGLASPVKLGVVSGHSMSPTLRDAQLYLLGRAYYTHHPVRRGDVLVFQHQGEPYVKRVAATAGDAVYLVKGIGAEDDVLVLDWQLPKLRQHRPTRIMSAMKLVRRRVPAGYCYVVGDNFENSVDSRDFGPVPVSAIEGRVIGVSRNRSPLPHLAGNFQPASAS